MSKKRVLSPAELRQLCSELQVSALVALMQARRWEPGEIAFRGGTSLKLIHDSARFSEDLDFMVRGGLSLIGLARSIKRNLVLPVSMPPGLRLSITASREDKMPHALDVVLSGEDFIGSARVKIELWQTAPDILKQLHLVVRTVTAGDGTGIAVPALTQQELMADKVYALGARNRLKARDLFDTWWLLRESKERVALDPELLCTRLAIYPSGTPEDLRATARAWLTNAAHRLTDLEEARREPQRIMKDLRRWLPSYWPLTEDRARSMIELAAAQLEAGMRVMREFVDTDRSA